MTSADRPTDPTPSGDPIPGNRTPANSTLGRRARGRRRVGLLAGVAAVVLVLDLVSKLLVVAHLPLDHRPVRLLGGGIYLLQTRNAGAAFSVGTGATIVLTVVALLVVAVIIRTARTMRSAGWAVALGLVLGGALGNLTDRVFRAPGPGRGHVVDWISLFSNDGHIWPIFNLADSAIVCGAILSALLALRGVELGPSAAHRRANHPDADIANPGSGTSTDAAADHG